MIDIIKEEQCTGCKMCADICPKEAIHFECNREGFWYPKVNYDKCIKCGLCVNKCPSLCESIEKKTENPQVFSDWSKNARTRKSSTSGGVFYEVARYVIEKGGAVAGCRYREDWKSAEHTIVYDMEGLQQIKGSKYFQSDTQGIYKLVKKEVLSGRLVLFCGTPCQNAALYTYLGKEYSNLIYMDFICRSINSPLAFRKYVEELEDIYGSKAVKVQLKNKKYGWQSLASQICFANGEESIKDKANDWWVKGFVNNDLYTRESCFECKYKVLPRKVADITIGDFWGIKEQSDYDMFAGISVVLLNTEQGKQVFEQVKSSFVVSEHTLDEVLPGNQALINKLIRKEQKEDFFDLLEKNTFSYSVRKCIKPTSGKQFKEYICNGLRAIKKILQCVKQGNISISRYIYYNYFCKNIIREGTAKVIPHKNAVLDLKKGSRIYLKGDNDLRIGINKLRGSKSETHIRMEENSQWYCNHGADVFYNVVIEVKKDAVFDTGYFSVNGGSVIIADKHIIFGEDVMLGRNIIIYDSDFHQLRDADEIPFNSPKPVIVEDHVWLTSNITVLKGVTIERDSLITAQTVVNKSLPEHSIIAGKATGEVIKDYVNWSRKSCEK